MVHTRRHRKSHRGGSNHLGSSEVSSSGVDDAVMDVPGGEAVPQAGGRRSRGGRRGGRGSRDRRSGGSRKVGSRKGGRRSHRGGFMAGLGAMLKDAIVPLGLTYYAVSKTRKNRSKRGGDDIA